MKPLWKLRSGEFAGYNINDILYNANGENVGYFDGNLAIGLDGHVVGEMYDDKFIGYRLGVAYSLHNSRARYANIAMAQYANYAGNGIGGWEDPHF
jgi:hypothetical protein